VNKFTLKAKSVKK